MYRPPQLVDCIGSRRTLWQGSRELLLISLEDLFELEMDVVGHVFMRNAEDVQRIIFPISYSPRLIVKEQGILLMSAKPREHLPSLLSENFCQ